MPCFEAPITHPETETEDSHSKSLRVLDLLGLPLFFASSKNLDSPRGFNTPNQLIVLVRPRNRGYNLPGNPRRENRRRRLVIESNFFRAHRLCTKVILRGREGNAIECVGILGDSSCNRRFGKVVGNPETHIVSRNRILRRTAESKKCRTTQSISTIANTSNRKKRCQKIPKHLL